MLLHIKNMVCPRCVMVVTDILQRRSLTPLSVSIGRAETAETLSEAQLQALAADLQAVGFELVRDAASQLVLRIKSAIAEAVDRPQVVTATLSAFIAERLAMDYPTLSRTFSSAEGQTIESYAVAARIERAQRMMDSGETSVKVLAFALGYSSVAHFSRQFKQVAGITPTDYLAQKRR